MALSKTMKIARAVFTLALGLSFLTLLGCGGSDGEDAPAPLPSALVTVSYGIKQVRFSWPSVAGATHYRLFERVDAASAFNQVGTDLTTNSASHYIPLHRRLNASYRIDACNSAGCTASDAISLAANLVPAIGYVKSSNPDGQTLMDDFGDAFGNAVALSANGDTLAVGEHLEDGGAVDSGAVYIFVRSAGNWQLQAYLKASNIGGGFLPCSGFGGPSGGFFGRAIALSADGNTLAVGAPGEDSDATGINGDQSNNSAHNSGAVYVFTRSAGAWTQQAYVKASNTGGGSFFCENGDLFGSAVTLSADGNTLAVGAPGEDSQAIGVDGNQLDNSANGAGAVYVFTRNIDTWSQRAYVKASNTGTLDQFGNAAALSGDGQTLVIGANGEDSVATGINGNQPDDSASNSGAVYIFASTAGAWSQQAYVKASNTGPEDRFGERVALSSDGNMLVIAAPREDSSSSGVNGNQIDETAADAGAVYLFTRSASVWSQQAYIKASNTDAADQFGSAIAVSGDGSTLAVGASGERSSAIGVGGNQTDNSAEIAGAVYLFSRTSGTWSQQAYVKASNSEQFDFFGAAVALNSDGNTLVVGAPGEDSRSPGIGGNQADNTAQLAGAAYLY
jgi:FG-GAP repeat